MNQRFTALRLLFFCLFSASLFAASAHAQLQRLWASYYGNDSTRIVAVQYDSLSNTLYVAGITTDPNLASPGAHKAVMGTQLGSYHSDMFLARFDTAGNRLWCTYFGGEGDEMGVSMALDHAGNIVLSGNTGSSTGIATAGSHMPTRQSAGMFLAKFSPAGQRLWGTYYGSAQTPAQTGYNAGNFTTQVTVDEGNNIYLYGLVASNSNFGPGGSYFTTPGTHQSTVWPSNSSWATSDVLVVKFNPSGQRLWGTFYGGPGEEGQGGIAVDSAGNVYLSGFGWSDNDSGISYGGVGLPPGFVPHTTYSFLAKLNPSGQMVWGGYREHLASPVSLRMDRSNHLYVYGDAGTGSQLGTPGTQQPSINGARDVFLIKYDSSGAKLWGSYYGSPAWDLSMHMSYGTGFGVPGIADAVSPMRNSLPLTADQKGIYISGVSTATSDAGIVEGCSYQGENSRKGFVAKFNTVTGQAEWGSFYDGFIGDLGLDQQGALYLGGYSPVNNVATPGSFQTTKPANKRSGVLARMQYACPQAQLTIYQNGDTLLADTGYLRYVWYMDGVPVQDSPIHHFSVSGPGSYYVVAEGDCHCYYTSNTLNTSVGVGGPAAYRNSVRVYPNPATSQVFVSSARPFGTGTAAILADVTGRTVLGPVNISGKTEAALKVAHLNGVYFLQVVEGATRQYFKVMVNGRQ